jgi:hypothetical protein
MDNDHPNQETDPALAETVTDFELDAKSKDSIFSQSSLADDEIEPSEQLLKGFDPEAHIHNLRVNRLIRRQHIREQLISEGAQFIYGLLVLTACAGMIALAVTIQSVELITINMIISPVVIGYTVISWKRWLRGAPYVYRLLTSLGEDAENLTQWHLPFFRF